MDNVIYVDSDGNQVVDSTEYSEDPGSLFTGIPKVGKILVDDAKVLLKKVEKILQTAPAFINAVKAAIPVETLQAVLTDEQKAKIAEGALKLLTKKDGTIIASLINPETGKIVATLPLKSIKATPNLAQALTNFSTSMQLAQISEKIDEVQVAVEEVRQGQEYDRLATAYSCQQKLLQAMSLSNPELRATALMQLVSDAEDSRNLLMLSQKSNVKYIAEQPESNWGKLLHLNKDEAKKIDARMSEIRDSLCAVNMVSFTEAIAYQELGEPVAARKSLNYYADYLQKTYLSTDGLLERLDLIDKSPVQYWSKILPEINDKILALPCYENTKLLDYCEE